MRLSTVVIIGGAVAAVGFGAYKLGHGVDSPASELATVAVSDPQQAAVATAESNLGGAEAAATTYQADHAGFAGMTAGALRAYDAGLSGDVTCRAPPPDLLHREHRRRNDRQHSRAERCVRRGCLLIGPVAIAQLA